MTRIEIENLGYKYVESFSLTNEPGFALRVKEGSLSTQLFLRPYDAKGYILKIFPDSGNGKAAFARAVYEIDEVETITRFFTWFYDSSQALANFHKYIESENIERNIEQIGYYVARNKILIEALGQTIKTNTGIVIGNQCVLHNPDGFIDVFDIPEDKDWKPGQIINFN